MSGYQLAQLNIATLLAPLDSPQLKDFVANLDRINALAESSDGFVWRWDESYDLDGGAAANGSPRSEPAHPFGDDVLVNLSVWRDVAALHAFAFRSAHTDVLRRRREWFAKMDQAYMVLWWVPDGHRPSVNEAAERLASLRELGPSPDAFTFRDAFPSPFGAVSKGTSEQGPPSPRRRGIQGLQPIEGKTLDSSFRCNDLWVSHCSFPGSPLKFPYATACLPTRGADAT